MPAGTVFAPYQPIVLMDRLAIKVDPGEEMPESYPYYRHTFNGVMPLEPWIDSDCGLWKIGDTQEASFEIYDGDTNDYSDYDMFLIFDEADIDRMINALLWAKNGCQGPANCSVE
jgi:hypothetical protein